MCGPIVIHMSASCQVSEMMSIHGLWLIDMHLMDLQCAISVPSLGNIKHVCRPNPCLALGSIAQHSSIKASILYLNAFHSFTFIIFLWVTSSIQKLGERDICFCKRRLATEAISRLKTNKVLCGFTGVEVLCKRVYSMLRSMLHSFAFLLIYLTFTLIVKLYVYWEYPEEPIKLTLLQFGTIINW